MVARQVGPASSLGISQRAVCRPRRTRSAACGSVSTVRTFRAQTETRQCDPSQQSEASEPPRTDSRAQRGGAEPRISGPPISPAIPSMSSSKPRPRQREHRDGSRLPGTAARPVRILMATLVSLDEPAADIARTALTTDEVALRPQSERVVRDLAPAHGRPRVRCQELARPLGRSTAWPCSSPRSRFSTSRRHPPCSGLRVSKGDAEPQRRSRRPDEPARRRKSADFATIGNVARNLPAPSRVRPTVGPSDSRTVRRFGLTMAQDSRPCFQGLASVRLGSRQLRHSPAELGYCTDPCGAGSTRRHVR
jgi:hypothetical protein